MLKWWLDAVDNIRREKFGDTEDLRQEIPSERQFLKKQLYFFLAVGAAVLLFQILFS